MASDQKCVSGEGSPMLAKYEASLSTCHQLFTKSSDGSTSGRILVSRAWSNKVHSAAVAMTTSTMAGKSRLARRR